MRVELEHGRGQPPLYVQLANALQSFILDQKLKPGDLLPSENVLAVENKLSRATVIKSFDTLVERGVVTRRQGKGTFVTTLPMARQLPELTGFSEHVHGLGLVPGSKLLRFEPLAADSPDRPTSGYEEQENLVLIERLRTVGESAVGVHRAVIPAEVADQIGLTEHVADQPDFSFYHLLHLSGISLNSGDESLRAINADAHDAEILNVDTGTALIEIVRASRDTSGRLVEVVRARYLGSHYLYHITFAPTTPGGTHEETSSAGARTGGNLTAAAQRMFG